MARLVLELGNRGFFPPDFNKSAAKEISGLLKSWGHEVLMMDRSAFPKAAVETRGHGDKFAAWLDTKVGQYDGIVWTHPNFGDEVGYLRAVWKAGRKRGDKIFLHAYPDDMAKQGPDYRRDSFCGAMSTMDVSYQNRIPFVKFAPHVVSPQSPRFKQNIDQFVDMCINGTPDTFTPFKPETCTGEGNALEGRTLLAIGARTTPFYTTRFNELDAVQNGMFVETVDLSTVFAMMKTIDRDGKKYQKRAKELAAYTSWEGVGKRAFDQQVRASVVMDDLIAMYKPDAVAIRCWTEWQDLMKMSVCATLSYLNHRGIPAACEVDLGNALTMKYMMMNGSDKVACQDWNNNYYEEDDKFEFMHCGPHDTKWLQPGHHVTTHRILDHAFGKDSGEGCIQGRFKPGPITIASCSTENGILKFYVTEGEVTTDTLPKDYFGSAGVAHVPGLQEALLNIGHGGYKHHFSMGNGYIADKMIAGLRGHEGYEVTDLRKAAR